MKKRATKGQRGSDRWRRIRGVLLIAVGTAIVIAVGARVLRQEPGTRAKSGGAYVPRPVGQLTFNRDVAPIIHGHCAGCHRPGESAPFELLTYRDVRDRAQDIVSVTSRGYMPPWLPRRGGIEFADERGLGEDELGVLRQWVAEGAVEGDPAAKPAVPLWTEGWQLGTPDLVVEMPEAYTLPAAGRDVYRNFVIPMAVPSRRFVRAVEFKAGTRVLHHVFMRFDRSQQSRRLDAEDREVGFGGMSVPPGVESANGHFLSWQPGRGPTQSPPGLNWVLEPGRDLVLQAHLQPSGKPELVQPRIGFYFSDEAPTNTPFKVVLSSLDIDIPAGVRGYEVRSDYVLPVDVEVLSVLPHAHYLAREIQGLATLPDGEVMTLLDIREWDFNWQSDYRYREPVFLPKGTRLDLRLTYDNSSENPRNPHQPPQRVAYGLQSTDEMGELWFQLVTRNPGDRRTLQADYDRRLLREIFAYNTAELRRNPTNAHARVQLAKVLATAGQSAEALGHFKRAVQLDPGEEEGFYHIGVLLMDSDYPAAESAFAETIRLNPENFKARNNLGLVLMRMGRFTDAETQFKIALDLNPNDRIVLENIELLQRKGGRQ